MNFSYTDLSKLSILAILLLLASCGATRQITVKTTEPAQVDFSNKFLRVGVVKRLKAPKKNNAVSGIDRLVTIEDQWLVTKGQEAAMNALIEELEKDNRFEVESLDGLENGLGSLKDDTEGTDWHEIKTICEKHDLDALFTLTHFDAETQVSLRKTKMEQLGLLREKQQVAAQELTLETQIQNGWRIYDPLLGQIVDEYSYDQQIVSKAKGVNPIAALRAIGSRKDSIMSKGKLLGNLYGERLKPSESKVLRDYYVKGTDKLVQAARSMDSGDTETAKELWKAEVTNPKAKIKGRACHNLAVGMELEGNLVKALEWASKANETLSDKNSENYLGALKARLSQQTVVDAQLARLNFED